MILQEVIDLLNEDLKNEYTHFHFYLQSAFLVTGLHRVKLKDFFFKQASGELEHIKQFAEIIVGLGGIPVTKCNIFSNLQKPSDILQYAIQMEKEVVNNYVIRLDNIKDLDGVNKVFLQTFLEAQIADSKQDIDEISRMLIE